MRMRGWSIGIAGAAVLFCSGSAMAQVNNVAAGKGLTGGGTGNVTVNVGQGAGLIVGPDKIRLRAAGQLCPPGAYMIGFDAIGNIRCEAPGAGNTIWFTRANVGSSCAAIYSMNTVSKRPVLVYDGKCVGTLGVSRDGAKIAFGSVDSTTGKSEIFTANADGTNVVQVTADNAAYGSSHPYFIAGGSKIWYMVAEEGCQTWYYEINADGSGKRQLTTIEDLKWGISTDAAETKVVFNREVDAGCWVPTFETFIADIDFTNVVQLTSNDVPDMDAQISEDGSAIAWIHYDNPLDGPRNVWKMNPDGTGKTQLTFYSDPQFASMPFWSPNGKQVAFVCGNDSQGDICLMNTDGTGLVNLTNTANVYEAAWAWR